jgi:hypothetical protein
MVGLRLGEELGDNNYRISVINYRYDDLSGEVKDNFIEIEKVPNKPEDIPEGKETYKIYNKEENTVEWKFRDVEIEDNNNDNISKDRDLETELLKEEIDELWITVLQNEGVL